MGLNPPRARPGPQTDGFDPSAGHRTFTFTFPTPLPSPYLFVKHIQCFPLCFPYRIEKGKGKGQETGKGTEKERGQEKGKGRGKEKEKGKGKEKERDGRPNGKP